MPALLLILLLLQEPRFTMAGEPDDRMRAELFEVEGGVASPEARALLPNFLEEQSMVLEGLPLTIVSGGSDVGRPVLLIGRAEASQGSRKLCRLTDTGGVANNLERAWRWCASFLREPPVTVNLPAPPPPR